MNSDNDECFKWAVTRLLNPVERDRGRITKILKLQAQKINWNDLKYPVKLTDIKIFEKNNKIGINVFSCDDDEKQTVYMLRSAKKGMENIINLFLFDGHYFAISRYFATLLLWYFATFLLCYFVISRLVSSQNSKKGNKIYPCIRCINMFSSQDILDEHTKMCDKHDHQKHIYPTCDKNGEKPVTKFRNVERMHPVPFTITFDFESYIVGINNYEEVTCQKVPSTIQYQKHNPSGFSYLVKCFDNTVYQPKIVKYTQKFEGEDISKVFVEMLEDDIKDIYTRFNDKTPICMLDTDNKNHKSTEKCYACHEEFTEENYKVRDHCHLTGKYRGAACNRCNLRMRNPTFITVMAHNLEGYDSHLFIKNLGVSDGNIRCIPKTEEKYISFSKNVTVGEYEDEETGKTKNITRELRFIDTLKFVSSSLDKLVNNLDPNDFKKLEWYANKMGYTSKQTELLKRKGVFPYEYMDSIERLFETELPQKSDFYSKLNNEDISDEDYNHAKKIWEVFECKTIRDYHDLYLVLDVLLLTDVMDKFRSMCMKNYKLDAMWYYTAPGLAWDASLKNTGVELDQITDPDIYLMIEKGIRGGVSTITKRYAKANNKYMSVYDPELDKTFIIYLDANNLYGWAMIQPLPTSDFKWMIEEDMEDWRHFLRSEGIGCILEVDLEYPNELHDLHNEYPFAPERIIPKGSKVPKLIPNLNNKKKYVLHCRNLDQYIKHGLKLTKIHRGIMFKESAWLKPYIDLNTNLRSNAKNDFEKDFFKLMNNSVFGKTMENVRNRVDVRLVTNEEQFGKLVRKPNYKSFTNFSESLTAVHMQKTTIRLNKPICLGMTILDLSKTLMYDFHYEYIKKKYGDSAELIFTDTDNLCYHIKTDDFYNDINDDVHSHFDTSNFPKIHPSGIRTGVNKKVLAKFKDEAGGKQIVEIVGLRSKLYAYLMDSGKEEKKCKGVKKSTIKNDIHFHEYKSCLFEEDDCYKSMNTFRSRQHNIYTERITKKALSSNDDKRIIHEDKIHTYAIGHIETRNLKT